MDNQDPAPAPGPRRPARPTAPPPEADPRSLGDLLGELASETTTLVKQEIALAKTEVRQEVRVVGKNAGAVLAGGAVAYAGLISLIIGLGWGLGRLFDEDLIWLGITVAGLVVALIGYSMLRKGLKTLQDENFAPERTIETVENDKQWLKHEAKKTP